MKKSEIQIFLAHASEDETDVLALYYRLKAAGYKLWLDKKNLIVGQKFAVSNFPSDRQQSINHCLSL